MTVRAVADTLAGLLASGCVTSSASQDQPVTHTRALASTLEAIVGLETVYPVSAVSSQRRWYARLPPVGAPTRAFLAMHEDG